MSAYKYKYNYKYKYRFNTLSHKYTNTIHVCIQIQTLRSAEVHCFQIVPEIHKFKYNMCLWNVGTLLYTRTLGSVQCTLYTVSLLSTQKSKYQEQRLSTWAKCLQDVRLLQENTITNTNTIPQSIKHPTAVKIKSVAFLCREAFLPAVQSK